jgi:WD40-like Beta Propeller Repeat
MASARSAKETDRSGRQSGEGCSRLRLTHHDQAPLHANQYAAPSVFRADDKRADGRQGHRGVPSNRCPAPDPGGPPQSSPGPDTSDMMPAVRARKVRRARLRRGAVGAMAVVVIAASAGTAVLLAHIFGSDRSPPANRIVIPIDPAPAVLHGRGAVAFFAGMGRGVFGLERLYLSDEGWRHADALTRKASYLDLAWSPDGHRIAYVETFGEFGGGRLLVRDVDSGRTTTLLRTDSVLSGVTWSPGGHWIAYSASVGRIGGGSVEYSMFAIPSAGGEPRVLTRGPRDDHDPASSPDGRRIAFMGGLIGPGNQALDGSSRWRPLSRPLRSSTHGMAASGPSGFRWAAWAPSPPAASRGNPFPAKTRQAAARRSGRLPHRALHRAPSLRLWPS